jgi:uncharacterized RDD family membrane protein YckC
MQPPPNVAGRRIAAFLIDSITWVVILVGSWFAFTTSKPGSCSDYLGNGGIDIGDSCRGFATEHPGNRTAFVIIVFASLLLIWWILPALKGTSPGHAAVGVKIVQEDGSRPGLARGFARAFFLFLLDIGLVGLIVMLTTERKQRVGDLVSGTFGVPSDWEGPVPKAGAVPTGQFAPTSGWGAPPTNAPHTPTPVPAGATRADWYPDPHGQARLRYWDGNRWTDHTSN